MSSRALCFLSALSFALACGKPPPVTTDAGAEICDNNIDDNDDGKIDCLDPECIEDPACDLRVERCDNGIDDNGDFLVDCEDPQCDLQLCGHNCTCYQGVPTDTNMVPTGGGAAGGGVAGGAGGGSAGGSSGGGLGGSAGGGTGGTPGGEDCTNGVDDNNNTLIDCHDPFCEMESCGFGCICENGLPTYPNGGGAGGGSAGGAGGGSAGGAGGGSAGGAGGGSAGGTGGGSAGGTGGGSAGGTGGGSAGGAGGGSAGGTGGGSAGGTGGGAAGGEGGGSGGGSAGGEGGGAGGGAAGGTGGGTGTWTCDPTWIGDGFCDCGCGTTDPDCAGTNVGYCQYCDVGSCSTNNCASIDPVNNAVCLDTPRTWTCNPTWQGDGWCDCGCGIPDSDCTRCIEWDPFLGIICIQSAADWRSSACEFTFCGAGGTAGGTAATNYNAVCQ